MKKIIAVITLTTALAFGGVVCISKEKVSVENAGKVAVALIVHTDLVDPGDGG